MSLNSLLSVFWVALVALSVISCDSSPDFPTVEVPALSKSDHEVPVRKWKIIGPFFTDWNKMGNIIDFDHWKNIGLNEDSLTFSSFRFPEKHELALVAKDTTTRYDSIRNVTVEIETDPLVLETILGTKTSATCYAGTMIRSAIDQDVIISLAVDDGIKLWVNNKICLSRNGRWMKRNDNLIKVHLNQGANFIMVKVKNDWDRWSFSMNIYSPEFADQYFHTPYVTSNFIERVMIRSGDSLKLIFNENFGSKSLPAIVDISSFDRDKVVFSGPCPKEGLSLSDVEPGIYSCSFVHNDRRYTQNFVYGDYEQLIQVMFLRMNEKKLMKRSESDNISLLFRRLEYLQRWGKERGYDNYLYRKMVALISDLKIVEKDFGGGVNPFEHKPGWHLRAYRSSIDSAQESYMVYMPPNYDKNKPIPLVITIPWIADKVHRFSESHHIADVDRLAMLQHLADKSGFGLFWPSARIYNKYNINTMSTASIMESLDEVHKTYNIDTSRQYLYGACSGGMFSLVLANRFPDKFAAVAVQGPELSYLGCETGKFCKFSAPAKWVSENSLLLNAENFYNIPIFIVHSRNDHKAHIGYSEKLANQIVAAGGHAEIDYVRNAVNSLRFEFYPNEEIMDKAFSFFQGKSSTNKSEVKFTTTQMRYRHAYWVEVDELEPDRRGVLSVSFKNNFIELKTEGVNKLTLLVDRFPTGFDPNMDLTIKHNGEFAFKGKVTTKTIALSPERMVVNENGSAKYRKGIESEGPIHDVFSSHFIVVYGTNGTKREIDSLKMKAERFSIGWSKLFFGKLRVIADYDLDSATSQQCNVILIGSPGSNKWFDALVSSSAFSISGKSFRVGPHKYSSPLLTYYFLHPNALAPKKYVLLIGSLGVENIFIDNEIAYKGWYDYEIYNNTNFIDGGVFDKNWESVSQ